MIHVLDPLNKRTFTPKMWTLDFLTLSIHMHEDKLHCISYSLILFEMDHHQTWQWLQLGLRLRLLCIWFLVIKMKNCPNIWEIQSVPRDVARNCPPFLDVNSYNDIVTMIGHNITSLHYHHDYFLIIMS